MNINELESINDWTWALAGASGQGPRADVRMYGSRELLEAMDEKVREQIDNVSQLPGLVGPAYTMPDAHWGYGFPIGGVAAFDPKRGGIICAGGVGFDISCGIRCLRTTLTAEDLAPKRTALADSLYRDIPAGVGVAGDIRLQVPELDQVLLGGAQWAVEHGYGFGEDLEFIEDRGRVSGAQPARVSQTAKKRQLGEMGTLGSGNHYLEVQRVDQILDPEIARAYGVAQGQILVSIHCGSRGLGHQIGTDYLISLAKAAQSLGLHLPDRELACAPIESEEGQQYLGAMNAGINCALANRQILTHLTRRVFAHFFPEARVETLFDVSHNTCKAESHNVNGKPRLLYVHRKGATRAFGPGHPGLPGRYKDAGQPVIIGGSMGTGSYLLAGVASSEERAWSSASHGAGRAMSRTQAARRWHGAALVRELGEQGVLIRTRSMRGVAEEAPGAYKDIERVALCTEQAGLAKRVARLAPVACVKG